MLIVTVGSICQLSEAVGDSQRALTAYGLVSQRIDAKQELQLYLDRVSQLLRAGGRLLDMLASSAEEEAYQKAVLASLATDPGATCPEMQGLMLYAHDAA